MNNSSISSTNHKNLLFFGDSVIAAGAGLRPMRVSDGELVALPRRSRAAAMSAASTILSARLRSSRMPEAWVVTRPNSKNYAHWLLETLPAIHMLHSMGVEQPVILPHTLKDFCFETLELFGGLDFVRLRERESRLIENALLPVITPADAAPGQAMARYRSHLLANLPASDVPQIKRIYVTRAGRRKVSNDQAVRALLVSYGFHVVDFEGMSVAQQAGICNGAKVMVAPHGAGMANAVFMQPGSLVMELSYPVPSRQDSYFFKFSRILGHRHYFVPGMRTRHCGPLERNEDFHVDLDMLQTLLDGLGIVPAANGAGDAGEAA
jgi:capsular polysaccharide biosynthesis protein